MTLDLLVAHLALMTKNNIQSYINAQYHELDVRKIVLIRDD